MTSRVIAFVDTNLGMLLIIVAQFFFVCMNLGVKQLDNLDMPMHTLELIAVRMGITLACCVLYMMAMKIPDPFLGPKGVRLLLVNRGLCGFFGLFGMYYSLQYLSLADATVLSFLSPLAAAIGGYIVLKEPYSRHEAFAASSCHHPFLASF
jgi:drug/metabolite transporter (DMT)-like permease